MIRAISADRRLVMIRNMNVMTMAKPRKVSIGNTPGVARRAKANRTGQREMQGTGRTDGVGAAGRIAADIRITIVVVKRAERALKTRFGRPVFCR
jgi:hypothetical protein